MTDLTKWPRLIVVGKKVTETQANEILLRTDSWWLSTNDKRWQAAIYELAGIPTNPEYGWPQPSDFTREINALQLHYLHNEQIVSSWIGGPHGWCSWDGSIGCSHYNIGKWPSVEEVTEDWRAIAAAWPFLDLRAQLIPDEGEAEAPAVEWRVRAGAVEEVKPGKTLTPPTLDLGAAWHRVMAPGGERGVSYERLSSALAQVRAPVGSSPVQGVDQ
jgi:hypothetical protein